MTSSSSISPKRRAWRRFQSNRPALFSLIFFAAIVAVVTLGSSLGKSALGSALPKAFSHHPATTSEAQFQPPSREHWFGTDVHGRDLFARVLAGARVSLLVGIVGASIALVIGVSCGAVAGYVGGKWDELMMRGVDILYSLPSIIFVIVLISTLETLARNWFAAHGGALGAAMARYMSVIFLVVGLGAVSWLNMARIVRGQVLSLRHRSFVEASRALGASHLRILWCHILPNTAGVIIVYMTLTIPAVVLYESFLSFLGLGVEPPMASWGSLISEGAQQLNPFRIYWWLIVFPGAVLVTTLLALNFIGDGLRDAVSD